MRLSEKLRNNITNTKTGHIIATSIASFSRSRFIDRAWESRQRRSVGRQLATNRGSRGSISNTLHRGWFSVSSTNRLRTPAIKPCGASHRARACSSVLTPCALIHVLFLHCVLSSTVIGAVKPQSYHQLYRYAM